MSIYDQTLSKFNQVEVNGQIKNDTTLLDYYFRDYFMTLTMQKTFRMRNTTFILVMAFMNLVIHQFL